MKVGPTLNGDSSWLIACARLDKHRTLPFKNLMIIHTRNKHLVCPTETIRGIIALTLLVGAVSLFIYSMDRDTVVEKQDFFYDSFEFFKTAFLMMIAFYFGGRSLEVLRTGTVGGFIPRFGNKKTTETPCPDDALDNAQQTDSPIEVAQVVAAATTDESSNPAQRGMAFVDNSCSHTNIRCTSSQRR